MLDTSNALSSPIMRTCVVKYWDGVLYAGTRCVLMSEEFAQELTEVMAAQGIQVLWEVDDWKGMYEDLERTRLAIKSLYRLMEMPFDPGVSIAPLLEAIVRRLDNQTLFS